MTLTKDNEQFQFFYIQEEFQSFAHFRLPKALLSEKKFSKLSNDSKFLYMLLLDRMNLSQKNRWHDESGRVFIYFTNEEACEKLGKSHGTVVRLMAELDEMKGIGLISRKKQGLGKPDLIFVKHIASLETEKKIYSKDGTSGVPKVELTEVADLEGNYTDKNKTEINNSIPPSTPLMGIVGSGVEEMDKKLEKFKKNTVLVKDCGDFTGEEVVSYEKETISAVKKDFSRKCDAMSPEENELTVDVDSESTKSDSRKNEKRTPRVRKNRKKEQELLKIQVKETILAQQQLPYEFTADSEKMGLAISFLTEYHPENEEPSFQNALQGLFCQGLTQMLHSEKHTMIKGSLVTYAKVYDKLQVYICHQDGVPNLFRLSDIAVSNYKNACQETDIKFPLAYMKACIWTALLEGDVALQGKLYRNYGLN